MFEDDLASPSQNSTDEEKILSSRSQSTVRGSPVLADQTQGTFTLENRFVCLFVMGTLTLIVKLNVHEEYH